MTEQEEKRPLLVCGREIGTYTSWDLVDDLVLLFYDFEPGEIASKCGLIACYLVVNFEKGLFETYNEAGEVMWSKDLVEVLWQLEKKEA